jgi:hypothetical protein
MASGNITELFRDGRVTRSKPPGGCALEQGCDWGYCDGLGYAWRWSGDLRCWLVVCVRCAFKSLAR